VKGSDLVTINKSVQGQDPLLPLQSEVVWDIRQLVTPAILHEQCSLAALAATFQATDALLYMQPENGSKLKSTLEPEICKTTGASGCTWVD
jgi:hypothetical protein